MLDQINIQYYSIPKTIDIELENDSISTFVVLRDSDWTDQTKELLIKMLKAVKLEENQYQTIIVKQENELAASTLFKKINNSHVLIFGLNPNQLQLNIRATLYQSITMENANILFSESLGTLVEKPQQKKPLWAALQNMYS